MVIIDPPFITEDVWSKYSTTAKLLLTKSPLASDVHDRGFVMAATVLENKDLMNELFGAKLCVFRPKLTNLVYQYDLYINFLQECTTLGKPNVELPEA